MGWWVDVKTVGVRTVGGWVRRLWVSGCENCGWVGGRIVGGWMSGLWVSGCKCELGGRVFAGAWSRSRVGAN